ncbi:hypothetical protein DP939_32155 [Spongiactinospora rosea]|uniref:Uncharacterized protein n=1 Tax=Spongiactinospora rosea TaxID=2248750 RepID=A0A366LRZ1_9ACTN|nr:hypothetical protein [Spongiactinospora rosea]RBQ15972.1 hypothetical protein DP939_32155 [Spongiactinospora rosea]
MTSSEWDRTQLAVAEYTSLRAEIVQLTELQTQIIGGAVVALGVVLSVGFEAGNAAVVLVYPLLSLVFGIVWLYKAHLIARIAAYLREEVEGRVGRGDLGWERFVRTHPLPHRLLAYWGLRSVFPVTSVLAIMASHAAGPARSAPIVLYTASCLVTAGTFAIFAVWREPAPEIAGAGSRWGGQKG